MTRASNQQVKEAEKYLKLGKGPASVHVLTGVSLSGIYSIQRRLRETGEIKEYTPEAQTDKPEATLKPPCNQVKNSLMTEEDIEKYGLPKEVDIVNAPKVFSLEIGPVGISIAEKAVSKILTPLKAMGIKDVYIAVKTGGKDVQ